MPQLVKVSGPRAGSAPEVYTVTEPGTFDVQSIFARFNGAGASGSFRPVVTIRAQNGAKLARVFPSTTLAAGDTADVTYAPFLKADISAIIDLSVVGASLRRPSTNPQVIPTGSGGTTITFDTLIFDTGGMWNPATPTVLTVQQTGLYIVSASVGFASNATGDRSLGVLRNGTFGLGGEQARAPAAFTWAGQVGSTASLSAGDTVSVVVAQTSGGNLNTTGVNLDLLGFGQV